MRKTTPMSAAWRVVVVAFVLDSVGCGGMARAPGVDGSSDGAFVHASVTSGCASCHDVDQAYASVPSRHRPRGGRDCSVCHAASVTGGFRGWTGAKFHGPVSDPSLLCSPCHGQSAPTSTAGWRSTTYATSPFDYGTNALGIAHGGDQDCGVCHSLPGNGQAPTWLGGQFAHVTFSLADKTCIACHLSQRPDLQPGASPATAAALVGFDHAAQGTIDCIGCHSATVARDRFVDYVNPATGALPGGDWAGGQSYPGAVPVAFPGEHIELRATTLVLSAAGDRVSSATVDWEDVHEPMIHTSLAVPAELAPGPPAAPDYGKCWHCHVNRDGVVTSFPMGKFHLSLAQYAATPTAPVTPLAQPARGCQECHATTRPAGIVARSNLQPMNHGLTFTSPAVLAGAPVTGVQDMDCSACHLPTGSFLDGAFHASTGGAALRDCVSCHYLTMADADTADVQNGTAYRMRHASTQLPFHTCTTCHPSALANMASATVAAESWKPGVYHAVLASQPTACSDCHAVSLPAAHGTTSVDGGAARDCSDCHAFPGTGTITAPNWLGATNPL